MGYTTEFTGAVTVTPPLNPDEISYLRSFNESRRMRRAKGAYFVGGGGFMGQDREDDIDDYNEQPPGQPGLWCQWTPSDDGSEIAWDGGEKFYSAEDWMRYLIEHFLAAPAYARGSDQDERFAKFTFGHMVNGVIQAQGERAEDLWRLVVRDNAVSRVDAVVTFPDPTPNVSCRCIVCGERYHGEPESDGEDVAGRLDEELLAAFSELADAHASGDQARIKAAALRASEAKRRHQEAATTP